MREMRVGGGKNKNDVNLRWSPAFLFVSSISTGGGYGRIQLTSVMGGLGKEWRESKHAEHGD